MTNADKTHQHTNAKVYDKLIDKAMDEISSNKPVLSRPHQLPAISPVIVLVLVIISVFVYQPFSSVTHDAPSEEAYASGGRIALLTIADDINAYHRQHGELPERLPSSLGTMLNIDYQKTGPDSFKIQMNSEVGILVLKHAGKHEDIYQESNSS